MKKFLSICLVLVFVIGVVCSAPITASASSVDYLSFELNEDGKSYYVSACSVDASGEVVIPATYNGLPVTSIGDNAFSYCYFLTSVTIPNSVTSIGDYAFYYCDSLTSITIPDSVTSIGDGAFEYCESLTSITIPNSVISIGDYAFFLCYALTSITVDDKNPNYCSIDGVLFDKSKTKLITYPVGKQSGSYTIPNGVTSIGNEAFYNCSALTSITIPDSVTSIGEYAFYGCESLTSVTIPNSVTSIGDQAFRGCYSLTSITIPNSVISIGDYAFAYCESLTNIAIPNSVTSIGDYTFYGCYSLTSVTIPNSVTSIGDWAFRGCESLTSITIPDSVTSIGDSAFEYCESLTSVTIPDSVTSIGDRAFYGCESLTSITIPDSVTSIGDSAFYGCESLTSITIPNSVISIGDYAFFHCYALTSITVDDKNPNYCSIDGVLFDKSKTKLITYPVGKQSGSYTIPNGVTSIGDNAFYYCESLTSIAIPNSVKSIGDEAFYDCSALTSIAIPDSVTSIGGRAFAYCESLTSMAIPNSVISIGDYAFDCCWKLKTVTISNSVKEIGIGVFHTCVALESVTIPNSVTTLPYNLFRNCSSLKSVTIPDSVTKIETCVFKDCTSLKSVTIPKSVTEIGEEAFGYYDNPEDIFEVLKVDGFTINGTAGSAAETYAKENDFVFNAIHSHTHSYTGKVIKQPTCKEKGIKTFTCSCGDSYTEEIPLISHTEITLEAVAATCTKTGLTEGKKCSVCGTVTVEQKTTPIVSHAIVVIPAVAPTYKEAGKTEGRKCAVCGLVTQAPTDIAKLVLGTPAVKIANSANGITVNWNAVEGAESYIVYRRTYNPATKKYSGWSTLNGAYTSTSYTDTKVVLGTQYSYTVRAVNDGVKSAYKATSGLKYNVTPTVKISNATNGIKVTWSTVANADGYRVYRSTYNSKTKKWSGWKNMGTAKSNKTSWTDKSVSNNTYYKYTVRAVEGKFLSSYKASSQTRFFKVPTVKIANNASGVKVTWSKISGATSYVVYRSEFVNGKWSSWKTLNSKATSTSYTDKTAKSGVQYKYTVRAVNGSYKSAYVASSTLLYLAQPKTTVAKASNGIKVSWTQSEGATGYTVYSSTYNTKTKKWSGWTNRGTAKATSKSWTDKKAKKGTTYRYTVRAVNGSAKSTYTASSSIKR